MKAYVAGPFFNDAQIEVIDAINSIINNNDMQMYSPKDECLYVPGKTSTREIFTDNLKHIQLCDFIVVVTDGKDIGTIFEAGYAFARGIPILYLWLSHTPDQKFNIMLKESGNIVCTTWDQFIECIVDAKDTGVFPEISYKGCLE